MESKLEIKIKNLDNEKTSMFMFWKGGEILAIIKERICQHGVFRIIGAPFFFDLTKVEQTFCMEYIENEIKTFEKDKGEIMIITEYASGEELCETIKNYLCINENRPQEGVLVDVCEDYDFFIEKQTRHVNFFAYVANEENYQKDRGMLRKVKDAITACKNDGYVLSGDWKKGTFTYYYHHDGGRTLHLYTEQQIYYIEMNQNRYELKTETVEEIKQIIVAELNDIRKKERLQVLMQGEKTPLVFLMFFRKGPFRLHNSIRRKIWGKLRTVFSYEELEKETVRRLDKGEVWKVHSSNGIHFTEFLGYYIALYMDQGKDTVMISKDKQELMNMITNLYQKEWVNNLNELGKGLK